MAQDSTATARGRASDMAYDKNFIEHHVMVAQLLEEHKYGEDETIYLDVPSVEFSVDHLYSLVAEVRELMGPDDAVLGMTCSASGLALRAFSTETVEIERGDADSSIFFTAFGDTHVVEGGGDGGCVYAGFINASGEQHFRRLLCKRR